MSEFKRIISRDNAFFKSLLKLSSSARERSERGQTLLDGTHLLRAFLDSGHQPLHLLINEHAGYNAEIKSLLASCEELPKTQFDDALFTQLSELKTPNGLLSLVDIQQPLLTAAQAQFILLLEDIQDPGNLGSMLRSAAAAGCDAVFLSVGCADAWSPKVLRAAMGGHFSLHIHENADLMQVAVTFGGKLLAASLQAEHSLYACELSTKIGFVIGNEGAGISASLQAAVQQRFIIPMPGKVESLNAAAATAVCLFEAARQRAV